MSESAAGAVNVVPGTVTGTPSGDGRGPGRSIGIDALVSGALEAIGAEAGGAPGQPPAPPPEPGEPPPAATDEAVEEALAEADAESAPPAKGSSKEDPLSISDLKSDQYVRIKIDGQEAVVSVREMADGYVRQETFSGRMRQAERVVNEAQQVIKDSAAARDADRNKMIDMVLNGPQLFRYMMGFPEGEASLQQAAKMYAVQAKAWKENPSSRVQFEAQRERERLHHERTTWEQQRKAEDSARAQREQVATRQRELAPGWEAGLRESGFPNRNDPEFQAEVRTRVMAVTQKTGQPITADQLRQCIVRAAAFLRAKPEDPKPAPARIPPKPNNAQNLPPRNPKTGQFTNPHRRGSPEYLLHGLKPPRF